MADTRHKDAGWLLQEVGSPGYSYGTIHSALLMDLRDELKQLNRTFSCENLQRMQREIRKLRIVMERLDKRFAKKAPLRSSPPSPRRGKNNS